MKKLFLAVIVSCLLSVANFAQTTPAKTAPKKKDGTADMRYKANKDSAKAAKAAGPLKKDGTPDKRYKANKDAKKKG